MDRNIREVSRLPNGKEPKRPAKPSGLPLVFTDALLQAEDLTPDEKTVLALTLGYPERNPSHAQLAADLAMDERTVVAAQIQLSAKDGCFAEPETLRKWDDKPDLHYYAEHGDQLWRFPEDYYFHVGQLADGHTAIIRKPHLVLTKAPKRAENREPNKLSYVRPKFDPSRPENAGSVIELPGAILNQLPRGKGQSNRTTAALVAAHYAREQLRGGAFQRDDATAAATLAPGRQTQGRERLEEARRRRSHRGSRRPLRPLRDAGRSPRREEDARTTTTPGRRSASARSSSTSAPTTTETSGSTSYAAKTPGKRCGDSSTSSARRQQETPSGDTATSETQTSPKARTTQRRSSPRCGRPSKTRR